MFMAACQSQHGCQLGRWAKLFAVLPCDVAHSHIWLCCNVEQRATKRSRRHSQHDKKRRNSFIINVNPAAETGQDDLLILHSGKVCSVATEHRQSIIAIAARHKPKYIIELCSKCSLLNNTRNNKELSYSS